MRHLLLSLLAFPLSGLFGQSNQATLYQGEKLRLHIGAGLTFFNGTNQLADHMELRGFGDESSTFLSGVLFGDGENPRKKGSQIYFYFAPEFVFDEHHSFGLAYGRENKIEVSGYDALGSSLFGTIGHRVTYGISADEFSFRYRHTFENRKLSLVVGPSIEFREITAESSRIAVNQNRNETKIGGILGLAWRSERLFCFSIQYRYRPNVTFNEQYATVEIEGDLVDSVLRELEFNPSYLRIGFEFIIPAIKE